MKENSKQPKQSTAKRLNVSVEAEAEARINALVAHMQTEAHRVGADATFALTGEELGRNALAKARADGQDGM